MPKICENAPGAEHFEGWRLSVVMEQQAGDFRCTVSARQRYSRWLCQYQFVIPADALMYNSSPQHVLTLLDMEIERAVKEIVKLYQPHIPGQLCHSPFCEDCYA